MTEAFKKHVLNAYTSKFIDEFYLLGTSAIHTGTHVILETLYPNFTALCVAVFYLPQGPYKHTGFQGRAKI